MISNAICFALATDSASKGNSISGSRLRSLLQESQRGFDVGQEPLSRERAATQVEAQALVEIALRLRVAPDASFGRG
jgi:hypothetical protein